ncbi:LOW QUALITY PROTEIN: DNA mismatch repair protein Mlh3 [Rhinatrema bivittatum]|uniref:LOW QUALITY PROTEIN: DNA mismatch repair protein Mlh3 n=1 Tax=Rhinatrema bivittatum TaxID=194408 RepID=UPI00112AF694|nr:LOW QUALITY PROTEIN: DNA mismatch repair protein Mlh3 [Rhinatrema bivittatum]
MIRRLPEELHADLRSGLALASLGQCVEELLLNSLDAGATCVAVRVDAAGLRAQVVDNGCGMVREDVELAGRRYFSSKCRSLAELEGARLYGFRGEALAGLAHLAGLLEICSRARGAAATFTKLFRHGCAQPVRQAEEGRPGPGTTVTVCQLFGRLPVRRGRLQPGPELERTRRRVEALALAHPAVSFSLRNDATAALLLRLPRARHAAARFAQLYGPAAARPLRSLSFRREDYALSGLVGGRGHRDRSRQFLYVNGRLVLRTRLHRALDALLRRVRSGPCPDAQAVYVLHLSCPASDCDASLEPAKTLLEFRDWERVLCCTEEAVQGFLSQAEPGAEDERGAHEAEPGAEDEQFLPRVNERGAHEAEDERFLPRVNERGAQEAEDEQFLPRVNERGAQEAEDERFLPRVNERGAQEAEDEQFLPRVNERGAPALQAELGTEAKYFFPQANACGAPEAAQGAEDERFLPRVNVRGAPEVESEEECILPRVNERGAPEVESEDERILPRVNERGAPEVEPEDERILPRVNERGAPEVEPEDERILPRVNERGAPEVEPEDERILPRVNERGAPEVEPEDERILPRVNERGALEVEPENERILPRVNERGAPEVEPEDERILPRVNERGAPEVEPEDERILPRVNERGAPEVEPEDERILPRVNERGAPEVEPEDERILPRVNERGAPEVEPEDERILPRVNERGAPEVEPEDERILPLVNERGAPKAVQRGEDECFFPWVNECGASAPEDERFLPQVNALGLFAPDAEPGPPATPENQRIAIQPAPGSPAVQPLLAVCVGESERQEASDSCPREEQHPQTPLSEPAKQPETNPSEITDCNEIEQEGITRTAPCIREIREKPRFVSGRISLEGCDVGKATNKARDADTLQADLCFTDFRTGLMSNQISEASKINDPLKQFARLGPVSAQEVFGNEMNISEQMENVIILPASLNTKYASLQNQVFASDTNSWKKKLTVEDKNNQKECFYDSGRKDRIWHRKNASLNTSHFSRTKGHRNIRNITKHLILSKPRKLSLDAHGGSLERFRRHYGRAKHSAPSQDDSIDATIPELSRNWNNFEVFSNHENTKAEPFSSKNNLVTLVLEDSGNPPFKKLVTSKDILLGDQISCLKREPLAWSDYILHQGNAVSTPASPGSLAAKLTRMKGNQTKVLIPERSGHVMEESNANLSRKDNTTCDLLQSVKARNQQSFQNVSIEIQTERCGLNSTAGKARNSCSSDTASCGIEDENVDCCTSKDVEYATNSNIYPHLEAIKMCSGGECTNTGTLNMPLEQDFQTGEFSDVALPLNLEDDTGETCSWLQHFDVSLGRTVYVNRTTGLSSYSVPPKENPTVCTQDLTTTAVNVVSSVGFQYRCYPFRSDLLLPFLPRARDERDMARQKCRGDVNEAAVGSLQSLLLEWENPVFACCSEVAVDVSSNQAERLAVKIHNILYPYRFTKEMIHSMKVLKQVDNKFIACLIDTKNEKNANPDGNLLVLVDQHAAHERIRLEQLITESYELQTDMFTRRKLRSSTMYPPLHVEISEEQRRLLRSYQTNLEELGLRVSFPEASSVSVLVHTVPVCFVEREATEARRGRQTVTKSFVEEFIQEQIELLQTAGGARGSLPPTVLKVLASQACRGAIKFNDRLSAEESCSLIEALSRCYLPFQCAHGRPSMLPLADTDHLQSKIQEKPPPNLKRLRKLVKAWQLFKQ